MLPLVAEWCERTGLGSPRLAAAVYLVPWLQRWLLWTAGVRRRFAAPFVYFDNIYCRNSTELAAVQPLDFNVAAVAPMKESSTHAAPANGGARSARRQPQPLEKKILHAGKDTESGITTSAYGILGRAEAVDEGIFSEGHKMARHAGKDMESAFGVGLNFGGNIDKTKIDEGAFGENFKMLHAGEARAQHSSRALSHNFRVKFTPCCRQASTPIFFTNAHVIDGTRICARTRW